MILLKQRHISQTTQPRSGALTELRRISFCLTLFVFISGITFGAEIDRLVAAVNGVAITEGDLDLSRSLNEIVLYGRNTASNSRTEEIERLIDQELMRQELSSFSMMEVEDGRIESQMQSLRDAFAAKGGLTALLQRTGLQQSELKSYIRLESSILKFVDFRFRPFVSVSEEDIRNYYEKRLVPQLRESKIDVPALGQISAKIDVILREEKINAVLDLWMKEIRRSSRIEYFNDDQ
jgi:parvulin-like peptidyl-prolyl isomerase